MFNFSSTKVLCHIRFRLRQGNLIIFFLSLCSECLSLLLVKTGSLLYKKHYVTLLGSPNYPVEYTIITGSASHHLNYENFDDVSWFTNPMKVLMCTTMLSPSMYFSLTNFLIREVSLRTFFLSYMPQVVGICIVCYILKDAHIYTLSDGCQNLSI